MKVFYLSLLLSISYGALAQQEYFNPENKEEGLRYYKNQLYRGCSDPKEKQEPILPAEMSRLVDATTSLAEKKFLRAFFENPKIKEAFKRDLEALKTDTSCQQKGNDCRAKLFGLTLYYYQTLRVDMGDCPDPKNTALCEMELKYRKSSLQGVQGRSNYGQPGPQMYKKLLVKFKNDTTKELFDLIIRKDKNNLHICNPVLSGVVHNYTLDTDVPGEFFTGVDPDYDPIKKLAKTCVEEKVSLHEEFLQGDLDQKTTLGRDEVEPVKNFISTFIKSHPQYVVTDVSVTVSSAKTPFYITEGKKKILDPKSNERNLSLAKERSSYVEKALQELKTTQVSFTTSAKLGGPDFVPLDLNDRFVSSMTPGYPEKLEALFKKYNKEFQEEAFIASYDELLNDKKYVNLYQAKFRPFHGFKIQIMGLKKDELKCSSGTASEKTKPSASKQ